MSLGDLFQSIKPEPAPPRRKRLGATTDSIALIANNGGTGCVLECDGAGIEASLEDVGKALDDNGLDDAPDGLSIWEGRYHTSTSHTDCGLEYDAELIGKFRDLTDREWQLLRETGTPWEFEARCPKCNHLWGGYEDSCHCDGGTCHNKDGCAAKEAEHG